MQTNQMNAWNAPPALESSLGLFGGKVQLVG
jgi:hypothetical protein